MINQTRTEGKMAEQAKAAEGEARLRATRARFHNIMGLEDLEIQLGKVTIIEGRNAAGKTSVLEGLKGALGGGNDATLIRAGEDQGEAVIIFDDGTEVEKVHRREGGAKQPNVRHPTFGSVGAGQTWIRNMLDSVSFNPVEFITAEPKRQMEMFLESAAVDLPAAQLQEIAEGAGVPLSEDETKALASWDGLRAMEYVRKRIYDERTGVNRSLRDKKGTIADLEAAVGEAEDPAAIAGEIAEARQELADMQGGLQEDIEAARARIHEEYQERHITINRELGEIGQEIARLQERQEALERDRIRLHDEEAQREEEAARSTKEAAASAIATRKARIEALETRQKAAERAAGARERLERARGEVEGLTRETTALTDALGAMEDLKTQLFQNLPIKGLALHEDGYITVDGVPLHRLNRARLMELAFWVGERRAGKMPLAIVDGMEALDADTFDAFIRHALTRSDLQYVVTRVGTGDLSIRTLEEGDATMAEQDGRR